MKAAYKLLAFACLYTLLLILVCSCNASRSTSSSETISSNATSQENILSPSVTEAPNIKGKYITLEANSYINTRNICSLLEFDSIMLCGSYNPKSESSYDDYIVSAFDLNDGKFIYSFSNMDYEGRGSLCRIEKSHDIDGFDYRLIFENSIVYRSSVNSDIDFVFSLPHEITPTVLENPEPISNYDINNKYICWVNSHGVWIAEKDGNNPNLIVKNEKLAVDYPDYSADILSYANPRFICQDDKIVVGIIRNDEQMYIGASLYNLDKMEIENNMEITNPDTLVYPILNRYICSKGSRGSKILDAQTLEFHDFRVKGNYPFYLSFDYKTVVIAKYSSMDFDGLESFITRIDNPQNESSPLLAVNDTSIIYMRGITEHYVLFSNEEDNWVAVSKYI